MITRILGIVTAVALLATIGTGVGDNVAQACPQTNSATLEDGLVSRNCGDGYFIFGLTASWHLKSPAAWVCLQAYQYSCYNVTGVEYTPSYLVDQPCEGSYDQFVCEGYLVDKQVVGVVTTQLDAGVSPNHASDVETTQIPACP